MPGRPHERKGCLLFLLPGGMHGNKINDKGMVNVKSNIVLTKPTWVLEKSLQSIFVA